MSIRIVSFFQTILFVVSHFSVTTSISYQTLSCLSRTFLIYFFEAVLRSCVVFATGDILSQSLSVVNNFFIFLCRCSVGSLLPVAATLINIPQYFVCQQLFYFCCSLSTHLGPFQQLLLYYHLFLQIASIFSNSIYYIKRTLNSDNSTFFLYTSSCLFNCYSF